MDDLEGADLVATQRATRLVLYVQRVGRITTDEAAALTEMTPSGAWKMLDKISLEAPLRLENNTWFWVD